MSENPIETIEMQLAILLRRATSISTNKKLLNLDRSAYLLLNQIALHGSAGVKALAEEFYLDISTVSRQAAALEQKGYVFRVPDPLDRRAYSLQISELGAKELQEYKNVRKTKVTELLKGWTDDERQLFGQLLSKFNHSFIKYER